ncbi:hypothetical protein ABTX60_25925 [Streptomyces sp. NPDC126510]|uniref:hypothetical protein n=1 Tax=Streptomyces sp. NPDC126510 TaxID=3155317 RepID=UPI00332A730E
MTATEKARSAHERLTAMRDVYDLLEEVRLRPGMWVRDRSLQHLDSMLAGYRVALAVHGAEEPFDFWSPGGQSPFDLWLERRMGGQTSLGWSTVIERYAEATGRPALELFFELLDEFRDEFLDESRGGLPGEQGQSQP